MIINLVLLGLIFGASKKKMKPYVGAALLDIPLSCLVFLLVFGEGIANVAALS